MTRLDRTLSTDRSFSD